MTADQLEADSENSDVNNNTLNAPNVFKFRNPLKIQVFYFKLKKSIMEEDLNSISLLVIVLDTNPSLRILRQNPQHLTQLIDSTIAFGNAHLMQKTQNKLAVLSCHHNASEYLYPVPSPMEFRQVDGQYEAFTLVERTIKQRLFQIMNSAPKITTLCESKLAGCMTLALCHINSFLRHKDDNVNINSRILVITGSNECASQYLTYMNVFFTARKLKIALDVCAIDKTLKLFQQGCDITGGHYLRLPQIDGMLQYLLWVFLPDPQSRKKLVLPPAEKVDYRAACFCHREVIDIGYVCSACLSIFCKFSPICTTCHTVFKTPGPLALKTKKRKKF